MLIIDETESERVAYSKDFKDVQITFTPDEWLALINFFEYRKKYSPSTFNKANRTIYQKLIVNKPELKRWIVGGKRMRLWHYELIPALPRKQLIAQWRELWAILSNIKKHGNPNHILVNKIMDYSFIHLGHYAELVYEEMVNRGYKINKPIGQFRDMLLEVYPDISTKEDCKGGVFKGWHNYRYLRQCYYNLQEKYDCGGISEEEWNKILEQLKVFIDIKFIDV